MNTENCTLTAASSAALAGRPQTGRQGNGPGAGGRARLAGRRPRRRTGPANGGGSVAGLRDAALILTGSDALLRVSELAALDWQDVQLDGPDGSGALTVRQSKTDQEGQGHTRYLGPPTVAALRRWRSAADLEADSGANRCSRLHRPADCRGPLRPATSART